jgi:hypothetical protein
MGARADEPKESALGSGGSRHSRKSEGVQQEQRYARERKGPFWRIGKVAVGERLRRESDLC